MKNNLINRAGLALAILAAAAWCDTARADLGTPISSGTVSSWNTSPQGNTPIYEAENLAGTQTSDSLPAAATGASYTVFSEIFSITNGAGLVLPSGTANYTLTGLGLVVSGATSSTNPLMIHLFDISSNLTGAVTSSAATYNFTNNGDLLGGGTGLAWSNNSASGEQQVYLPILNGPDTYDQVVLGAGHIYALEIWSPTTNGPTFTWYYGGLSKDTQGQAMGSQNGSLTATRETLFALHDPSTPAQKTFGFALYGSVTTNALSSNTSTNLFPTNVYYVIDAFNALGYGPPNPYTNPTNYSNATLFDEIWTNWYGAAWVTNLWDPSTDASGNSPNSGSLEIVADFNNGGQFLVSDYPQGIHPPFNAVSNGINSFQCDVLFSNGSAVTYNGSVANYGHLQFGMAVSPGFSGSPDTFGSVEVPVGTTNWTHVNLPLNALNDGNLDSINDVVIKIDGSWYPSHALNGSTILWVDNIKFVGPAAPPPPPPPPTLQAQAAQAELRIFAGSIVNTYDREELDTVDQSLSWVNASGGNPATISFTLLDFPVAPGMQCHVFLVPINSLPAGNNPTANEYVDYQASNNVWLDIAGRGANPDGSSGYSVGLLWKVNTPNANASTEALTGGLYTNTGTQSPVGTWTLQFTSATDGTVTPPGVSPLPFHIADPNIRSDFANPVYALIGLQPNSTVGEGRYIDYGQISITGFPGGSQIENFTSDPNALITDSGLWDITDSVNQPGVVLVNPANTPLWVNWSLPDINYGLGESPTLPITLPPGHSYSSPTDGGSWVLPSQFNGYATSPTVAERAGGTNWDLIPSVCLPSNEFPTLTNAYFELLNPAPAN